MEDQDAVNNIIPVATSLLQSAMGMFNHLTDIDLSHNSISQLPAYLPLPACANTFNLSYNDLIGNLPTVTYF